MTKGGTLAGQNVFYCARIAAGFGSRETVSAIIKIGQRRIARIELGNTRPYEDEVVRMADVYSAPELLNYYCSTICSIGKDNVPHIELSTFDRMARKGLAAIRRAKIAENILIRIAPDGEIRAGEEAQLLKVLHILQSIEKVTLEMEIYIKKNLKGCE